MPEPFPMFLLDRMWRQNEPILESAAAMTSIEYVTITGPTLPIIVNGSLS